MPATLIDTDILIDAARGNVTAISRLQAVRKASTVAVSVVTQMELTVGCQNKTELRTLDKFLRRFQVVQISPAVSTEAISLLRTYRLSHGLLIPDSLIAATALTLQIPLISKNQRDYKFIKGLNLLPYPGT